VNFKLENDIQDYQIRCEKAEKRDRESLWQFEKNQEVLE
jgi:hypothetical protein